MTTASCFATGIEERVWGLLPAKAQKRVQSLAAGHEGLPLLSAMACDEDAMSKEDIIAEDGRENQNLLGVVGASFALESNFESLYINKLITLSCVCV